MVKIYADLIQFHKINEKTGEVWTINDVPERYREAVQAELDRRG